MTKWRDKNRMMQNRREKATRRDQSQTYLSFQERMGDTETSIRQRRFNTSHDSRFYIINGAR